MVIVDTSVWIDYLRGNGHPETVWLDRELQQQPLGLTDLILCEVLQGTPDSAFAKTRDDLLRFHVFANCSPALALAAAQNYRILRRKGYTVRATIDCLIATFCLENDHHLLHRDRDFDSFEKVLGLRVVHA
jgi:predicted nucleic acid-binding protein